MPLSYVQNTYFDAPYAGYPGQFADDGSARLVTGVRSYITETLLVLGRFAVKGAVNSAVDAVMTPVKAKAPLSTSVAADFLGIVHRGDANDSDANNNAVTIRATTMATIAERGSGAILYVEVPPGITIAHGDPVWVSVSHATIPVGAASNATATGLVQLTDCTWYGAALPGGIGRIKLGGTTV